MANLALGSPAGVALDVCCGTGDITMLLAKSKQMKVVGVDFSFPMLKKAYDRLTMDLPVSYINADALKLPFPDEQFSCATIAYGLRNLRDLEMGLKEIWRVLRPEGRLLILDFGKPSHAVVRAPYYLYLRTLVPLFGKIFCGDSEAYGYILESLNHYPAQTGVSQCLEKQGAQQVTVRNYLGGIMSLHLALKPSLNSSFEEPS